MPRKQLILSATQKQNLRDLSAKYTRIGDIVRESKLTRFYVYNFLREEGLIPQAREKARSTYVPKERRPIVVLRKAEEKKQFVRPRAEYSNSRSLYNLD